jgi:hypothetical protein
MDLTYALLKKTTIGIMGSTLLIAGITMIILPGPGILAIIAALSLLATEFLWAHKLMVKYKLKKPEQYIRQEEKVLQKEEKKLVKKMQKTL